MTKVVYNSCYGGFSFSDAGCRRLLELKVKDADVHGSRSVSRHDPKVIQVVEELGEAANGRCARLTIATIEGSKYRIDEYDGAETPVEPIDLAWIEVPAS